MRRQGTDDPAGRFMARTFFQPAMHTGRFAAALPLHGGHGAGGAGMASAAGGW